MKRLFVICTLLLTAVVMSAQEAKRVYITLDVSGSMIGDKYNLANYTTQMIVTLCDDDDDVSLIVTGKENKLTKVKEPLKLLQHPRGNSVFSKNPLIPAGADMDFEINDILSFNNLYKPSKDKQDWIFIIGDGYWDINYNNAVDNFKKIVETRTLNVCYLQTGTNLEISSPFTTFAESLGVVDISKSDTNAKTIKAGCDHFARKILGFSDVPLDMKKSRAQDMSFKLEMPLTEFYLVYQAETAPEALPGISAVDAAGVTFDVTLKGTPTTIPLKEDAGAVNLSGKVWKVKANSTIPAGTTIEVKFDKGIELDNINVYPVVKGVETNSLTLTREGTNLKQLDSHTFSICKDENKAMVRVGLNGKAAESIPAALLEKSKVVVKSNNKSYEAKYKDGAFECEIPLDGEETQYYAECDCPGYFKCVTPIMKIVKGDCAPVKPDNLPVDMKPTADLGTITFEALKHDDIRISIHDTKSLQALDPTLFDISFEVENDFLYEKPKFHIENETLIVLELHPYGEWCECLFPEGLNVKMISTPKDEAFQEYDKNYRKTVFPMHMEVVKSRPWLSRCLWVLITLGAMLLFMAYLRALLKKNRFHKHARLKNSYYVEDNPKEVQKNGKPLRRPGFGPWLNRWLNPFGDERMSTSFTRPKTGSMTFIASESKNRILMTEASFDANRMTVPNYTPKPKDKKNKEGEPISITAGTSIEIKKMQGGETTRLGHLKYVVEGKDDEGGYRAFVGLLFALTLLAFLALLWQMIRGFF